MKQNITVGLDREVIRSGKILAAMQGNSLSRLASDRLHEAIRGKEAYLQARNKALAQMRKGSHGGGRPASREERHER